MVDRLVLAGCALVLIVAPVHAQSPCSDCFNAAQAEAKKCLDNAISAGDRNDCLETRHARTKACSENQCREDREEVTTTESQPTNSRPGVTPYTPTEGEWLALLMRAGLRREATPDHPYSLDIVLADPQTLQIVVRHASTLDRNRLNKAIEAAREAIKSTARSYGWDKWVKIRETVEAYPAQK
ncbi:MAG: hypothetical protein H8K10_20770 [Nitrospira sp.]|nr:hypothetical protein [Nitrospira sp.]